MKLQDLRQDDDKIKLQHSQYLENIKYGAGLRSPSVAHGLPGETHIDDQFRKLGKLDDSGSDSLFKQCNEDNKRKSSNTSLENVIFVNDEDKLGSRISLVSPKKDCLELTDPKTWRNSLSPKNSLKTSRLMTNKYPQKAYLNKDTDEIIRVPYDGDIKHTMKDLFGKKTCSPRELEHSYTDSTSSDNQSLERSFIQSLTNDTQQQELSISTELPNGTEQQDASSSNNKASLKPYKRNISDNSDNTRPSKVTLLAESSSSNGGTQVGG